MDERVIYRFNARVDRSGGPGACWPWTAAKVKSGYGAVRFNGKVRRAHRVAFFLEYGRWPEPCGCHSCDNRPCCNPAHIFEGTVRDNNEDTHIKKRHYTGPSRGPYRSRELKKQDEQLLLLLNSLQSTDS